MTHRAPYPLARGPLKLKEYAVLLLSRDRTKFLTALAGAELVSEGQEASE